MATNEAWQERKDRSIREVLRWSDVAKDELLAALLRERGYEKRWAFEQYDYAWRIGTADEMSLEGLDTDDCQEIYVPLQREEPE